MTNWRQERHPTDHTDRVAAPDLRGWLANEPDLQLLDVREHGESDAGHLPGSVLTPWHDITGIPEGFDPTKPIAVICAGGTGSDAPVQARTARRGTRVATAA
jgi:rhodanese-related sulfurtransferase